MKATMIATGGLSGGISATIAGGNFWGGFIQGIITAGLNHVAHSTFNNLDNEDSFSQQQKDPWDLNGDGKMSLNEANNWYRNGDGKAVTLDASKIDLNNVKTRGWVKGKTYNVQTLVNSSDGRVLGNITVKYLGNNKVSILADTYNFEQHGNFIDSPFRNAATVLGKWVAGEGQQFQINFKGVNTIIPFKGYDFTKDLK